MPGTKYYQVFNRGCVRITTTKTRKKKTTKYRAQIQGYTKNNETASDTSHRVEVDLLNSGLGF